MSDDRTARRTFLERAGLAALSAGLVVRSRDAHAQIAVPNSAGTESPKLEAPANACDCHMHIYDPARFPMVPSQRVPPTAAAVPQYRAPERIVWGSDWPHPTEPPDRRPNDAVLFDLLSEWAPDEATRHRILVENPVTLYGFGRSL